MIKKLKINNSNFPKLFSDRKKIVGALRSENVSPKVFHFLFR